MVAKFSCIVALTSVAASTLTAFGGTDTAVAPLPKYPTLTDKWPLVIAHCGANSYLPEYTLEGYKRAIELGLDLIESDLVATKDGGF